MASKNKNIRAFRYFGSHWIETLRDKRFKLAKPSELNDPFDCVGAYTGNIPRSVAKANARRLVDSEYSKECYRDLPRKEKRAEKDRKLKEIQKVYKKKFQDLVSKASEEKTGMDEAIRLLCMSCPVQHVRDDVSFNMAEVLMWSHYADNHHGVRVGITMPLGVKNIRVLPVEYTGNRPLHDWSVSQDLAESDFILKVALTKSPAWIYENEIRLIASPKCCKSDLLEDGSRASFLTFETNVISRVDFGLLMEPDEEDECIELLNKDYPHVEVYKAKYHPTEYRLDYQPIKR